MSSVHLGEARLVAVAIHGSDSRFAASAALSGGDDGVAHAPVRQPTGTAVVQPVVPGGVQLSGGGQLGAVTQTVSLGLPEGEALGGGAMEHLTFTGRDRCQDLEIFVFAPISDSAGLIFMFLLTAHYKTRSILLVSPSMFST